MKVSVTGLGAYRPPRLVENEELTKLVETSDEWIRTRTGIERRHVSEGETVLEMAEKAARQALETSGVAPAAIGPVIVATSSPDRFFPMAASLLRARLGLGEGPAFDLSCGCTGLMAALQVAASMLEAQGYEHALIVGSEYLTRLIDWSDRSTCVLFGDGAGAFVLSRGGNGIAAVHLSARSDEAGALSMDALPARNPWTPETAMNTAFRMSGQDVFRFAVEAVPDTVRQLAARAGKTLADIDWIVPHQANLRIIHTAANRLGVPLEKFFVNIADYGNTGAASIALALDDMRRQDLLRPGQNLVLAAFGAGFAWGGAWLIWQ